MCSNAVLFTPINESHPGSGIKDQRLRTRRSLWVAAAPALQEFIIRGRMCVLGMSMCFLANPHVHDDCSWLDHAMHNCSVAGARTSRSRCHGLGITAIRRLSDQGCQAQIPHSLSNSTTSGAHFIFFVGCRQVKRLGNQTLIYIVFHHRECTLKPLGIWRWQLRSMRTR